MKIYSNRHELRGACSSRVEKAVSKVPRHGMLGQPADKFDGRRGRCAAGDQIHAVEDAGYGASPRTGRCSAGERVGGRGRLKDRETPVLKHRLIASLGF